MTDALIPLGMTEFSERYRQAEQIYNLYKPRAIVGHSLASHLVMKLSDKYDVPYRAYATPTISMPWQNAKNRYSHYGDPISVLDMASQKNIYKGYNPHSYGGY